MIENSNLVKDGNAAVVQMDTVLELLKKTILLIGQCSNNITYERRKNILLGVTGTSNAQVAAILKEKASFLQKHDKALFGKEFADNLAETVKAKRQSIGAITELSRPTNRQPFRGGPSQNNMGGGQRQHQNKDYKQGNGKGLFFGISPFRNISLPNPTLLSMEVLTHASTLLKHIFKNDSTNLPCGRKVKTFSTCMETTYKRLKYLVLSRRIEDHSATRIETCTSSFLSVLD